jgi:hypothetical protein
VPRDELLAAALAYAAAGWPVHPCRPGAKEPLTRWREAATTDPETITAWWDRWPAANVAIATGEPGPDVVDVDRHQVDGGQAYRRLRDAGLLAGATAVVVTPSGGWHLYYRGTGQGNGSARRHGIDFRGAGGYVLAPPSVVNGQPYRLHDRRPPTGATVDWQAIRRHLDPPQPRPPGNGHTDCAALVRWVAGLAEGGRNEGTYWAARRAVEAGADPGVYEDLVAAAITAGLPEAEARRTIASAQRGSR